MSLGPGGKILLVLAGAFIIAFSLQRYGLLPQARPFLSTVSALSASLHRRPPRPLAVGDFPSGVTAPVADLFALPARPVRIAVPPRAAAAPLLWLSGGAGHRPDSPASRAYALDLDLLVLPGAEKVREAFLVGGDRGGADAALVSVDQLAMRWPLYRDAAPRAVYLVARSQGSIALVGGHDVPNLEALRGKSLAVAATDPARYFELFELARVRLSSHDVRLVPAADSTAAARALREARADAACGMAWELSLATKDRAGKVLATTGDAPHLVDFVLAVRGDFIARYPEAVRRLVRAMSDAGESVRKDSMQAARLLDAVAPALGDPIQAVKDEPPATFDEALGFFGLAGDAPVRFDELFQSAAGLAQRLSELSDLPKAAECRDLMPLKALAASRAGPPPAPH